MKQLTHWYLRMQVVWQNEAVDPLISQDGGGVAEWSCWPIGFSGWRWHDRMKLLTHWYLRMEVVWQNEAVDPLVSQDAGLWCDRIRMKLLTHWNLKMQVVWQN
jgi:hypothetical protein